MTDPGGADTHIDMQPDDTTSPAPENSRSPAAGSEANEVGGDRRSALRNMRWVLWWVLLVLAVGIILDNRFRAQDSLAAANKAPLEMLARVENFDRPDADNLDFGDTPLFLVTSGAFGVTDGVATRTSEGPAVALASLPGGKVGAASVTINNADPAAGLVVRYRDADNYWLFAPSESRPTWTLYRVSGGSPDAVRETTQTFGREQVQATVQLDDSRIVIRVNGAIQLVHNDGFLQDSGNVGLYDAGPAPGQTSFDNFAIYYPVAES